MTNCKYNCKNILFTIKTERKDLNNNEKISITSYDGDYICNRMRQKYKNRKRE